jgi:DNA-binding transcriptional ArsR family regulator
MLEATPGQERRRAAIALLRELRRLDERTGVRHSGIARYVGLLLYEAGASGLSVTQISAMTGYSGPTIRLVLERLAEASVLAPGERRGKTQFYRLTAEGTAGFDAYVGAVLGFATRLTAEGDRAPPADHPADRLHPPIRYGAARPARAAAE